MIPITARAASRQLIVSEMREGRTALNVKFDHVLVGENVVAVDPEAF